MKYEKRRKFFKKSVQISDAYRKKYIETFLLVCWYVQVENNRKSQKIAGKF